MRRGGADQEARLDKRHDEAVRHLVDTALDGSDSLNARAGGLAALTALTLALTINFSRLWLGNALDLAEATRDLLLVCLLGAIVAFAVAVGVALRAARPKNELAERMKKARKKLGQSSSDELFRDIRRDLLCAVKAQHEANETKAKWSGVAYRIFFVGLSLVAAQAMIVAISELV